MGMFALSANIVHKPHVITYRKVHKAVHQKRDEIIGSAADTLSSRTNGMCLDFVNDNFVFKQDGEIYETGGISDRMPWLFAGGLNTNANGFYFDGTTYFARLKLWKLPWLNQSSFTYYCHIFNANNTTGTTRQAMIMTNASLGDRHTYEFVQGGQTRSKIDCRDGGSSRFTYFTPSTIVGVTEHKRGVRCLTNSAANVEDGVKVGNTDTSCVMPAEMEFVILGNFNSTGSNPLLATFAKFWMVDGGDSDALMVTETTL